MSDFQLVNPTPGPRQDPAEEYFPTPPWATKVLLERVNLWGFPILEPACGEGDILNVLRRDCGIGACGIECNATRARVAMNPAMVWIGDFLASGPWADMNWLAIVTNPPFSLYVEFVQRSLALVNQGGRVDGYVCMLAPTEYLGGLERAQLYQRGTGFQKVISLARRPWAHAKAMSWFVWHKGYGGPAEIEVVP